MKAIMKSVSPIECERIASGEQTILVSKTGPKIDTPFKCYIYRTTEKVTEIVKEYDSNFKLLRRKKTLKEFSGKVIGEFICDEVYEIEYRGNGYYCKNESVSVTNQVAAQSCLDFDDLFEYLGVDRRGYGWHISDLKIYDEPKELEEFIKPCPFYKNANCPQCEFYSDYFGDCRNIVTRIPYGWCYVEEL